jgi:hypothetical protein
LDTFKDEDAIQFEPEYAGELSVKVIGYTYDPASGFARERATVNVCKVVTLGVTNTGTLLTVNVSTFDAVNVPPVAAMVAV